MEKGNEYLKTYLSLQADVTNHILMNWRVEQTKNVNEMVLIRFFKDIAQ